MERVGIDGLMTMAALTGDPRPAFAELRRLRDVFGQPLKHLSMGMTHDYEVAIQEGATILRIGTAIFGERE